MHALSEFVSFEVKRLISNGTEGVEQGVIFSLLCVYISNFRHSDWPRTQNVNKRADWLTLFALVTWINTKKTIDTFHSNNTCNPNFSHKLPNQFIWDNNFFRTYTDCLRSPNIQQKIQHFLINEYSTNSDGINNCLNDFEDIILEAGMKRLKIKKVTRRRKIRNTTNKKWFDKECRFKRHTVRKIANKKHKDPQNLNLRNSYHEVLKDYKNTLRRKKDEFYQQKLNELESAAEKNPQSFWKVLKTVDDEITNTTPNNIPDTHNGIHIFKPYIQNTILIQNSKKY